jgi:hypothetical protein
MSSGPRPKLLLIVTGSTLRAEEMDRPLGYYLKQKVEKYLADHPIPGLMLHVLVVADFRWLNDDPLQTLPTISVGGPGVNAVARQWFEDDLTTSLAVDGRYYIQMDPELRELRASIWGMDNATTQFAVAAFLSRFLPRFLKRCADDDVPGLLDIEEADDDQDNDSDADDESADD